MVRLLYILLISVSNTQDTGKLETKLFLNKTFRHGFPYQPTAMAFDPVQQLLAIGSKCGSLRILGQPGVDVHVRHDMDGPPGAAAVIHLQFLVNEGSLISATADDTLHLWNFRQKVPQVVQSLKFQREKITCIHLPLQSKWMYAGTEKGNVHVVQIDNFILSGYVINWNKAIEILRKTHPGPVVHLSDNPIDPNKLLLGYESGQIVLWDLKSKTADIRCQTMEPLRSISWHHEGKQFMCSHTDGSLTTWSIKQNNKPIHISQPHAKVNKDGKLEQCKPINKVEWKSSKSGEAYVIFSGGMPYDQAGRTPSITVVHSKTTTVLEMEHNVIDFITLCESPYCSEMQEPYAIIVLLQNDLVVMDLQTAGFPCIENPYPMDIHESSVTCCSYLADCPADLIPALYSVGRTGASKRQGFSEKEWPISGGTWSAQSCSYSEIIMTGHSDGSIKFWDASAGTLQFLYKLKTAKVFEKPKMKSLENEDEPFAIQLISLCPESRTLCIAGASSHIILFKFKKSETSDEVTVLEIPIVYEIPDDVECSPDCEFSAQGSAGSGNKLDTIDDNKKEASVLKVRLGVQKKPPGFQAQLVCLTLWNNGEPPTHITALTINSSYGLMAYGNEAGIVVVDIEQRVCLLNIGSPDLYGAQDPYSRAPRSPKRNQVCGPEALGLNPEKEERQPRSPSVDQLGLSPESLLSFCPCPTPVEPATEALEDERTSPIPHSAVRRKSSTWKTFNLKRRLSKVDMKLKGTFSGVENLKDKPTSVFYCSDLSPSDLENPQEEEEDEESSPDFDENTVIENVTSDLSKIEKDDDQLKEYDVMEEYSADIHFLTRNSANNLEVSDNKIASSTSRPDKLEFVDETSIPIRPQRGIKKKELDRRDQRLLSVPNIKFQKPELLLLRDLRYKDESAQPSGQSSFAGNLMRRFMGIGGFVTLFTVALVYIEGQGQQLPQRLPEGAIGPATACPAPTGRVRPDPPRRSRSQDKLDSSFSRSRSSSMSSLENITSEAIQCLAFADSYTRKSEPATLIPTLWVGTSLGSVLTIHITPPDPDSRSSQPVVVSLVGVTIFRLKGSILAMSFLDCNGALIPYSYEPWKDENREKRDRTPNRQNRMSPTLGESQNRDSYGDRQFVVIVSEKQARVVALPSQNCVYRQQIADTDFVVKTEVISLKDSVCLVCYVSNGHLVAYSLPSLRALIDIDFLPLSELRISRTFCFSNKGHGLYLCSPSELQKFTLCTEFCLNLPEMMGELFLPLDMPEAPKESFFKGLFGGGVRSLDREELFGESSGKANKSVAKHIPGSLQDLGGRASTAAGEISRAHKLAMERGDKLNQLEEKAERMRYEAENFSQSAHELMLKYKDKKWYQL